MREILTDLLKQATLFDVIKVIGNTNETRIEAIDSDSTFFLRAKLKKPIPEFEGQFGISNLSTLAGLLEFPNYKTDDATFEVVRREVDGAEIVSQFTFKDGNGGYSEFKLMNPRHIPQQGEIGQIPWEITFTPDKAKVAEFTKLANLLAVVDKVFSVRMTGKDLQFCIGDENSATHRAVMVFEPNIEGTFRGEIKFSTQQFLSTMKLAGNYPVQLNLISKGVMSIGVETNHGIYNYILRASR